MQNPILIGTGFFATSNDIIGRGNFAEIWHRNTSPVCSNIVAVDNSEASCADLECYIKQLRVIHVRKNLGCAATPPHLCGGPLLGWSISWIIPALIAYSEGCDFVYKEQDCLAFGDWLPVIRRERMSFGRNQQMPCEQSLFYIRHDFILEAIRLYLSITGADVEVSTEEKFRRMMDQAQGIVFHDLPGGRDRPMPDFNAPFYLQRISPAEMRCLIAAELV